MISYSLANANASVISVGATASALLALIDTAGSTQHTFRLDLDAVDLVVESGDIRLTFDLTTPTASKGLLVKAGSSVCLRHIPLRNIRMIAVTGSSSCSVQIGTSETSETTTISASTGSGSGSSSSIGGGSTTYSNASGDFTATANASAKTITFSAFANTVLSSVISTTNFMNCVIRRKTSAGVMDTLPTTNVAYSAGVLTLADMTANFAAGDTVEVFIVGPDKAYDEANDQLKVTQNTYDFGDDSVRNVKKVEQQANYTNISASALIVTGSGVFYGFIVNSCAAGATVKVWDQTSAAVPVLLNTMTFSTAVAEGPKPVPMPAAVKFSNGCYVTIAGAAADITVITA